MDLIGENPLLQKNMEGVFEDRVLMCFHNLILIAGFVYEGSQTLEVVVSRLCDDYVFTVWRTECVPYFVTSKFSSHGLEQSTLSSPQQ